MHRRILLAANLFPSCANTQGDYKCIMCPERPPIGIQTSRSISRITMSRVSAAMVDLRWSRSQLPAQINLPHAQCHCLERFMKVTL
jgi:hypothetical protein